jgi:hypothetical protein
VGHGGRRLHLRLRPLPRRRDPRPHPQVPHHDALLPAHDVPHDAPDRLRRARPLVPHLLRDGGRGAQPRPLPVLEGAHGPHHPRGLRPDRDLGHRGQLGGRPRAQARLDGQALPAVHGRDTA